MTDGRLALLSASAIAGAMPGGSAMSDAMAVQNFKNPRREIPCRCRVSNKFSSFGMASSFAYIHAFVHKPSFIGRWHAYVLNNRCLLSPARQAPTP
jgi:hypothetical protein